MTEADRITEAAPPQIVLTGGTGFIGRRLARRLPHAFPDAIITCLVRDEDSAFERAGRRQLEAAGLAPMPCDLVTGRGLKQAPASPTIVFHLAASTETREQDHRCNDVGTRHLLEAMAPLGPNTHVVYFSSMAVTDDRADYRVPLTEESPDPDPPCNAYSRAKLRAEHWLRERCRLDGFALTILRPATVYGAEPRARGMFDSLRALALRGSWIGRVDWPARTGYIYVEDVVEAIVQLAQRPPPPGSCESYIMCTEHQTLATISEHIHRALGRPYRPIRLPPWVWKAASALTRRKRLLQRVLPHGLYNVLWRVSLIVDPVLWAETDKLANALTDWYPSRFADRVGEVVG